MEKLNTIYLWNDSIYSQYIFGVIKKKCNAFVDDGINQLMIYIGNLKF